jgi:pimeloyl-ACP methyl ester carboxylesterase
VIIAAAKRVQFLALFATTLLTPAYGRAQAGDAAVPTLSIAEVVPSVADPALTTTFDQPNLVVTPSGKLRKELVVFLPGTKGSPEGSKVMISAIASFGFRVVGVMYNDAPTGETKCRANDNPECLGHFREERVQGDDPDALEQNSVQESIVARLAALLKYELKANPGKGWEAYLDHDQPNWKNIIMTGHSLGSGMAAYIAQYHEVARVVLFSGPSDGFELHPGMSGEEASSHLSAWLYKPNKTPPDRWFASYHNKELVRVLSPLIYDALRVPRDHITVFSLEPPPTVKATGLVAFHMAVVNDTRYLPQWRQMFGVDAAH